MPAEVLYVSSTAKINILREIVEYSHKVAFHDGKKIVFFKKDGKHFCLTYEEIGDVFLMRDYRHVIIFKRGKKAYIINGTPPEVLSSKRIDNLKHRDKKSTSSYNDKIIVGDTIIFDNIVIVVSKVDGDSVTGSTKPKSSYEQKPSENKEYTFDQKITNWNFS